MGKGVVWFAGSSPFFTFLSFTAVWRRYESWVRWEKMSCSKISVLACFFGRQSGSMGCAVSRRQGVFYVYDTNGDERRGYAFLRHTIVWCKPAFPVSFHRYVYGIRVMQCRQPTSTSAPFRALVNIQYGDSVLKSVLGSIKLSVLTVAEYSFIFTRCPPLVCLLESAEYKCVYLFINQLSNLLRNANYA